MNYDLHLKDLMPQNKAKPNLLNYLSELQGIGETRLVGNEP